MIDPDLETAMAAFQQCILDRDQSAADRLLDADYELALVHPARGVVPRTRWIETLPDYVVFQYDVEECLIDVDGDTATVLHRATMAANVLGQDRSGAFVISDIWRKRSDGWRVWRRHSTPLTAGPMPRVD